MATKKTKTKSSSAAKAAPAKKTTPAKAPLKKGNIKPLIPST